MVGNTLCFVMARHLMKPIRGFSQAFYREKLYKKHFGFDDLESFMVGFWESWATSKGSSFSYPSLPVMPFDADLTEDPENLLVMLRTWQSGDCSLQEPYNGDFEKAMASIKAKTLVLPCKTDLYFP